MTKAELNSLVFWMQEAKELKDFQDVLNVSRETRLFIKTEKRFSFITWSRNTGFKKTLDLTEINRVKLWAFLDKEIRHLEGLIEAADPETRELAEDIINNKIGKAAMGFLEGNK